MVYISIVFLMIMSIYESCYTPFCDHLLALFCPLSVVFSSMISLTIFIQFLFVQF